MWLLSRYAILKEAGAPRTRLKKVMQLTTKGLRREAILIVEETYVAANSAPVPSGDIPQAAASEAAPTRGHDVTRPGAAAAGAAAATHRTDSNAPRGVSFAPGTSRGGSSATTHPEGRPGRAVAQEDAPIGAWASDTTWVPAFLAANAGKRRAGKGDPGHGSGISGGDEDLDMVRVAVRLRPMMPAEVASGEQPVVHVAGKQVTIDLGPKSGKMRFMFDHAFDSTAGPAAVTQEDVFEVGARVSLSSPAHPTANAWFGTCAEVGHDNLGRCLAGLQLKHYGVRCAVLVARSRVPCHQRVLCGGSPDTAKPVAASRTA